MLKRLLIAASVALVPAPSLAQAVTVTPDQAQPGSSSTIQLVWQVYLGGFNLGNIGLKSSFSGTGYSAVSKLKTVNSVCLASVIRLPKRSSSAASSTEPDWSM